MDADTHVFSLLIQLEYRQATLRFLPQDLQQSSSQHDSRFDQDSSTTHHSTTTTSRANYFLTTSSRAHRCPTNRTNPLTSTISILTQKQSRPNTGPNNPSTKQERDNRKQRHTHTRYIGYANSLFPAAIWPRESGRLKKKICGLTRN